MESMDSRTSEKCPHEMEVDQTQTEDVAKSGEPSESKPQVPKHKSQAWDHFIKTEDPDIAKCAHCGKPIKCKHLGRSSTSSMLNHLKACKEMKPEIGDEERDGKRLKQTTMYHWEHKGQEPTNVKSFVTFDQQAARESLARWIILAELPFATVEHPSFKDMMHTVQPRFEIPSRRTMVRDCVELFIREKSKLMSFFKKFKYSVCLTTDLWTSRQNMSFMSLTAHFIDDDWRLHKKIINFCPIYGHTGYAIRKKVEECLVAWKISNVTTITVDNASANDAGLKYLKERFKKWNGIAFDGDYLHMRCATHILNLIVRDGLSELKDSIERIRSAIVYVRSSSLRTQKFKDLMEKQKIKTNAVAHLDVDTRWNSTYDMLESALRVKDAFDLLEMEDDKFREELAKHDKEPPAESDWSYARGFLPFLKCFCETTETLSGSKYVTGNMYMKEIFRVAWNIQAMSLNSDGATRLIANKMKTKFFKYWGNWKHINPLIYIATVLDPRHKMRWVSFAIHRIYEQDEADELEKYIRGTLERMFKHYESLCASGNEGSTSKTLSSREETSSGLEMDLDTQFEAEFESFTSSAEQVAFKSELEKYLTDECENRKQPNFDILYWWKTTGSKYTALARMARDVLAIPVSTVASESAFSTGGRVIDPFRSSLTPPMVEALVCTQDWLRGQHAPIFIEEVQSQLEEWTAALKNCRIRDD